MGAGHRCLAVHLRLHAVDSWAFVSLRPRSFPFTGVRFRWWAVVSVRARLSSLVGVRVHGVVVMVRRGASLSFVAK